MAKNNDFQPFPRSGTGDAEDKAPPPPKEIAMTLTSFDRVVSIAAALAISASLVLASAPPLTPPAAPAVSTTIA
jgi:hypothetical protein